MSIFDKKIDRSETYSVKYNKRVIRTFTNNEDAAPFWVADMDFSSPQVVLDALQKEIDSTILGYPYIKGVEQSFISFAEKRHNITIDPSLVAIAPGMLASIATLVELYSKEGDSIVLPFPSYHPFVDIINNLNREIVAWPFLYDENNHTFSLDFATLEKVTKEKSPSILLFCSPHNPTGVVFSKEDLEKTAKIAKQSNMVVISDEIHADLAFKGVKHIPFSEIAALYDLPCATCMAPSKTFNIAGEHFSVVVCSDVEMKNRFTKRLKALQISPDVLATVASKAAYDGGYDWLISLIQYLEENSKMIKELLEKHNSTMHFITPEASFIGFIECKHLYRTLLVDKEKHPSLYASRGDGGILSRFFGQKAHIAMNDGSWFGDEYKEFVRFNYAAPKEVVQQAILKLIEAEKELQSQYNL